MMSMISDNRLVRPLALALAVAASLGLSAEALAAKGSYILVAAGEQLPAGIERKVSQAGGTVTRLMPGIGAAIVSSDRADFSTKASRIAGVSEVIPNLTVEWLDPTENVVKGEDIGSPPTSGDDDFFFDLQWGHVAVKAVDAWNVGATGQGARVAVLDGGFDTDHPDLAPNIDMSCSADMTGEGLVYGPPGPFSHGTHVAGTIAAADNGFGVIGIAPNATLCLVKVLGDGGSGSFADVAAGIVHAADQGVDIINMSLGAALFKNGVSTGDPDVDYTAREAVSLKNFIDRAVGYAYQHGVLVVASAGNDGIDGDKDFSLIHTPSDAPQAISISATAPIGWVANPPSPSLDYLASYSNYGRSVISLAAPGGDVAYPGNEGCVVAGLARPCWVFDLVFSTGNNTWYWSAGTSMASPHAAGVAALIVGKYGKMHPSRLRSLLERGADDLGQPGNDPAYGAGRVNAYNAVQ